jgi:hypothetical protein
MATLPAVDENSSARLRCTFLDYDDAQQAPASGTYQVDTKAGDVLRAATAFTPAAVVDLILDSQDNAIVDDTLKWERHIVTIKASYGGDDELNGTFEYRVRNLIQVT